MKNKFSLQKLFILVLIILAFKIFFPWIFSPSINGGDWPYYDHGMFSSFNTFAPLWTSQSGGFGGVNSDFPIFGYLNFTIGFFVNIIRLPWPVVYKILWFMLPLAFGFLSISSLYKVLREKASLWELTLVSFIYLCNSYFLLVAGGGQMGIVLAYSIAPSFFAFGVKFLKKNLNKLPKKQVLRDGLISGLILAVVVFFDPRIAFLIVGVALIYSLFSLFFNKQSISKIIFFWIISFFGVFVVHAYWIIPFYIFNLLVVPSGITSSSGFSFFSFADFSHAFSFLHPNWPENIFGKVYFQQPEFLIYPLLAFLGLLFLNKFSKKEKFNYLFLSFVGILGVFFAKGVQDPFGFINSWLFSFPGFNLFRDPTKYYILIAISYSIMIPFTVKELYNMLNKKIYLHALFFICVIFSISFPIREGILSKLKGTFTYNPPPKEYLDLANFLSLQRNFFRTLWIPDLSKFRYISEIHPILIEETLFHTSSVSGSLRIIESKKGKEYLEKASVKYIIVPDDTLKEIFLTDRGYDDKKRQSLIKSLDKINYLKKFLIGKIVLYQINNPKDHFYFQDDTSLNYVRNTSSDYRININISKSKTLIFAENYNPGWYGFVNGKKIKSIETKDKFNGFLIPKGKYVLKIKFVPQQYQIYFYAGSIISLAMILFFLLKSNKFK